MTIIVYNPIDKRIWTDTGTTGFRPGAKSIMYTAPKHWVTYQGHIFAATGSIDSGYLGRIVDKLVAQATQEVAPPSDDITVLPDTSLIVRSKSGKVYVSSEFNGGMILTEWDLPFPYARGSGALFFEAFFLEHGDVEKALNLTCEYAEDCALPLHTF